MNYLSHLLYHPLPSSIILYIAFIGLFLAAPPAFAQTSQSRDFSLEIGVTPPPPTPTPFQSQITIGFPDAQNGKPMRLTITADSIDYGPMNPTNPIKRKINVSVHSGSSPSYSLFLSQNHPLSTCHPSVIPAFTLKIPQNFYGEAGIQENGSPIGVGDDKLCQTIPNTTCDNGACTEKSPALWNNPFTFGFGFSRNDSNYRQFPTSSQNQPSTTISPGDLFVKVNTSPNQEQKEDEFYQNTLLFLLLPKL